MSLALLALSVAGAAAADAIAPVPLYSEVKVKGDDTATYIVTGSSPAQNETWITDIRDTSFYKTDHKDPDGERVESNEFKKFQRARRRYDLEQTEGFTGRRRFAPGETLDVPAMRLPKKGRWVRTHRLVPTGVIYRGDSFDV